MYGIATKAILPSLTAFSLSFISLTILFFLLYCLRYLSFFFSYLPVVCKAWRRAWSSTTCHGSVRQGYQSCTARGTIWGLIYMTQVFFLFFVDWRNFGVSDTLCLCLIFKDKNRNYFLSQNFIAFPSYDLIVYFLIYNQKVY